MNKFYFTRSYYEGAEGEGAGGGSGGAATFTQEQLNNFLAKEKKAWQASQQKTVAELTKLKEQEGVSAGRVTELEETIKALEVQYMTKDELAKRETEKQAKALTDKLESLTGERTTWQNNYQQLLIENEIVKASQKLGAFSDEQMLTQLGGKAKVVPVIVEGKPTGKYQVVFGITDAGKTLELTAEKAMEFMKEKPEQYGNLFKANVSGGFGGGNNGVVTPLDLKKVAADSVSYRQNRSKILNG